MKKISLCLIFILIMIIVEVGNLGILKSKDESEIKRAISYGFRHLSDDDVFDNMYKLISKNTDGTASVSYDGNLIKVSFKEDNVGIILKKFDIDVTYVGDVNSKKIYKE